MRRPEAVVFGEYPPSIFHECQNKGLARRAIRKVLKLRNLFLVIRNTTRDGLKRKKRQKPAAHCVLPRYYLL